MTLSEDLWSISMLGVLLIALQVFRSLRRRTRDFSESQAFKVQLPSWVRIVEMTLWVTLLLFFGGVVFSSFLTIHRAMQPGPAVKGATALFSLMGTGLIALPIAFLGANAVSWILAPVRAANLHAMSGLDVSFSSMNRGLVLAACVSVPLGFILLVVATFEPWAH